MEVTYEGIGATLARPEDLTSSLRVLGTLPSSSMGAKSLCELGDCQRVDQHKLVTITYADGVCSPEERSGLTGGWCSVKSISRIGSR